MLMFGSDQLSEVGVPSDGSRVLTNGKLGHTATVFGATGFLGRYIVNRLGMNLAKARIMVV